MTFWRKKKPDSLDLEMTEICREKAIMLFKSYAMGVQISTGRSDEDTKHAVDGFTEVLDSELTHQSKVLSSGR